MNSLLGIDQNDIVIKNGFPPSVISVESLDLTVTQAGIRNRDTIIVEANPSDSIRAKLGL